MCFLLITFHNHCSYGPYCGKREELCCGYLQQNQIIPSEEFKAFFRHYLYTEYISLMQHFFWWVQKKFSVQRCVHADKQRKELPSIRFHIVPKQQLNIPWNVIWKFLTLSTPIIVYTQRKRQFKILKSWVRNSMSVDVRIR